MWKEKQHLVGMVTMSRPVHRYKRNHAFCGASVGVQLSRAFLAGSCCTLFKHVTLNLQSFLNSESGGGICSQK